MATATHTDPILISPPVQVSALLTQVAGRMFDNAVYTGKDPLLIGTVRVSLEIFEAWALIRRIAHLYGTQGLVYLDGILMDKLTDAVLLAHRNYHHMAPPEDVPCPEACDCELSGFIRKAMTTIFSATLELDKEGETR
jgi:hypothetical protein